MSKRTITIIAGVAVVCVVMLGMATVLGGVVLLRVAQASTVSPVARLEARASRLADSLNGILPDRSTAPAPQTDAPAAATAASGEEGVLVASVMADSPAARAGIVRGDIILAVDGAAVNRVTELSSALSDRKADDRVTVTVRHGDDTRKLDVKLAEQNGRTYLGIVPCASGMETMPQDHMTWNQELGKGAVIVELVKDGPAQAAGLKVGDRILSVDGQAVDADNTLPALIGAFQPGDKVTLEVASGTAAETRDVSVTLGQHPDKEGIGYLGVRVGSPAPANGSDGQDLPFHFGVPGGQNGDGNPQQPFNMPDLPQDLQDLFRNGMRSDGVVVLQVEKDSPAAAAGITTGDVITAVDGKSVSDFAALRDAIAGYKPGDKVTLTVTRSGADKAQEITATLGKNPADETKAYLGISAFGMFRHAQGGQDGQLPSMPDLQDLLPNLPFNPQPTNPLAPPSNGKDL